MKLIAFREHHEAVNETNRIGVLTAVRTWETPVWINASSITALSPHPHNDNVTRIHSGDSTRMVVGSLDSILDLFRELA